MKIQNELLHEGTQPFKCDTCDAIFSSKESLNRHNVSTHKENNPNNCDICHKNFSRKHGLD
jgi:uncharacterized Zn-finger protein